MKFEISWRFQGIRNSRFFPVYDSAYRQSFPFAWYDSYYILNEYSGINDYQQKIISIHMITDFSQSYVMIVNMT